MRRRRLPGPEVLNESRFAKKFQLDSATSDREGLRRHHHEGKLDLISFTIERDGDDIGKSVLAENQLPVGDPSWKFGGGWSAVGFSNHKVGILSPTRTGIEPWPTV
jgi:hypothetical protein